MLHNKLLHKQKQNKYIYECMALFGPAPKVSFGSFDDMGAKKSQIIDIKNNHIITSKQ